MSDTKIEFVVRDGSPFVRVDDVCDWLSTQNWDDAGAVGARNWVVQELRLLSLAASSDVV